MYNILRPTIDSATLDNLLTTANLPVNCPLRKYAHKPSVIAVKPWPTPQSAPIFKPCKPDLPTLGAMSAARWSGPMQLKEATLDGVSEESKSLY